MFKVKSVAASQNQGQIGISEFVQQIEQGGMQNTENVHAPVS